MSSHSTSDRNPLSKNNTLPSNRAAGKRFSQAFGEEAKQYIVGKKKRDSLFDSSDAMAQLEAKLALIRGDLESLRIQGRDMSERVAVVTASVQAAGGRHEIATLNEDDSDEDTTPRAEVASNCGSRLSLEVISESDCEEQAQQSFKKFSMSSLGDHSKRDSGIDCSDPAFEMMDPVKYCALNNLFSRSSEHPKKTRSTTSLEFIKNNLHDDAADRLKATSCDRLSCFSDSALLTFSVKQRVL